VNNQPRMLTLLPGPPQPVRGTLPRPSGAARQAAAAPARRNPPSRSPERDVGGSVEPVRGTWGHSPSWRGSTRAGRSGAHFGEGRGEHEPALGFQGVHDASSTHPLLQSDLIYLLEVGVGYMGE